MSEEFDHEAIAEINPIRDGKGVEKLEKLTYGASDEIGGSILDWWKKRQVRKNEKKKGKAKKVID